jgi:hypothetical protein
MAFPLLQGMSMHVRSTVVLAICAAVSLIHAASAVAAGESSTASGPGAVPTDPGPAPRIFVTLAPGVSSLELLAMASLTIEISTLQLSVRALTADGLSFRTSPTEGVDEYAVLLGKAWHRKVATLYAQGGLGRASTLRRGKFLYTEDVGFMGDVYEGLPGKTWAFAFEAGIDWSARFAGIGVALVCDVNPQLSMVGLALTLRAGMTR